MRRHVCWSGSKQHYYIPSYLPCHRHMRLLKHITTCYTPWFHSQHALHVSKLVYISKFVILGALNSLPSYVGAWCSHVLQQTAEAEVLKATDFPYHWGSTNVFVTLHEAHCKQQKAQPHWIILHIKYIYAEPAGSYRGWQKKKLSNVSPLTNHFFYRLDVSSCDIERYKYSFPSSGQIRALF